MKIKGTFLSYISEEKRLRKEQNRVLRNSAKNKKSSLETPAKANESEVALQLR